MVSVGSHADTKQVQICIRCKRGVAQPVFGWRRLAILADREGKPACEPLACSIPPFAIVFVGTSPACSPFTVGFAAFKARIRAGRSQQVGPCSEGSWHSRPCWTVSNRRSSALAKGMGVLTCASFLNSAMSIAGEFRLTECRGCEESGRLVIVCQPLVIPTRKDGDDVAFSCRPPSRVP